MTDFVVLVLAQIPFVSFFPGFVDTEFIAEASIFSYLDYLCLRRARGRNAIAAEALSELVTSSEIVCYSRLDLVRSSRRESAVDGR